MTGNQRLFMWLLKTDPETYSLDDLERDKTTTWDGVRNNQALIYLRRMTKGDLALIYHSGDDKHVAGLAEIIRGPDPDPKLNDPKLVVVDLKFKQRLPRPPTLAQIKADPTFVGFHLVRISRLSVMPVQAPLWKKLLTLGGL